MDKGSNNIEDVGNHDKKNQDANNTAVEEIQKKHPISDITQEVSLLLRNVSNFFTELEREKKSEREVFISEPDEEISHIASKNEIEDQILLGSELKKKATKILALDKIYQILSSHKGRGLETKHSGSVYIQQHIEENQNSCSIYDKDNSCVKPGSDHTSATLQNDLAALSMMELPSESFEEIRSHVEDILRLRKVNQEMSSLIQKVVKFIDKKKINQQETHEQTAETDCQNIERSEPAVKDEPEKDLEEPVMEKSALQEEKEDGVEKPEVLLDEIIKSEATINDDQSSEASTEAEVKTKSCLSLLEGHLKGTNFQKLSLEEPNNCHIYKVECHISELITEGIGLKLKSAKEDAAYQMIRLITSKQNDGTLPEIIPPFSSQELDDLALLLDNENENYVRLLLHKCHELQYDMPTYLVLDDVLKDKQYNIRCSINTMNTFGKGYSREMAQKIAAKNMLQLLEEESKKRQTITTGF